MLKTIFLTFSVLQLFWCQTAPTHQSDNKYKDLESYLQAREAAARNDKIPAPRVSPYDTYNNLKKVSEEQGVSIVTLFQLAFDGMEAQEIDSQYKKGLISESERNYKAMLLREKMEKSGVASFLRRASSNPPVLNSDRFYKISQCNKLSYNEYDCKDEKESYKGRGRQISNLFLPSSYETFRAETCVELKKDKYRCVSGSFGYEGKGLISHGLFLPIYPK